MKNNKGFVLSTYVYMLLVFFLLMLTVMLSVLGNSKLLANKMKEGLSKILGANGGTISIILKGNKEDYTFLGSEYEDPGYVAKSSDGENLEADISSNVDTSKLGTYKITYTVKKFGKSASVERIVSIIEGSYDYNFIGGEDEFTVAVTGYYRLEAWGAQGGNASSGRGGFGGYTTGIAYLTKGTKLYINVGGKGTTGTAVNTEYQGGYNGGGYGKGGTNYISAGGGGATHIATKKGLLSTFETSLQDVLIVAGGGGGAGYHTGSYYGHGGEGGGLQGNSGVIMGNTDGATAVGKGGTQTTGASFGQGANNGSNGPGGGGGFYGGMSANTYRGAGGGSGYVGVLLEAETYGYDGSVSEEAQSYSAKKGNGYAKITYIGNRETPTITTVGNSLVFERPTHYEVEITKSGYYNLEAWGAQGGSASSGRGGFGSYTEGVAYLEAGTTLHIYVGGKGQNVYYNKQAATGGYNGGGNSSGGNNYMAAAGGGATHIATKKGLLETLSDSLQDVLIVAGGGGGGGYHTGSYYGFGGDAGGIQGNKGTIGGNTDGNTSVGAGGTQTEATNSLSGLGKNGTSGAGGGSGYYGGTQSGAYRGAGGGSGYIGNPLLTNKAMYCYNCTVSSDTATKTISTTCTNDAATENCAKTANGYVRITYIGE